jgi:hypothetical protein
MELLRALLDAADSAQLDHSEPPLKKVWPKYRSKSKNFEGRSSKSGGSIATVGQGKMVGAWKRTNDRIRVLWPHDGLIYGGIVLKTVHTGGPPRVFVKYDDGEEHWADFVDGQWQCLWITEDESEPDRPRNRTSSVVTGKTVHDGKSDQRTSPLHPPVAAEMKPVHPSLKRPRSTSPRPPLAPLASVVTTGGSPTSVKRPKPSPERKRTKGVAVKPARPRTAANQGLVTDAASRQKPDKIAPLLLNSGIKRTGERISVFWPLDDRCYKGTVTEVDSDKSWLLVKYDEPQDDGSDAVFWACLEEGRWQCRWVFEKHEKDLAIAKAKQRAAALAATALAKGLADKRISAPGAAAELSARPHSGGSDRRLVGLSSGAVASARTHASAATDAASGEPPKPAAAVVTGAALTAAASGKTSTGFPAHIANDCGTCKFCLDKRKNGGPDKLRKPCVNRQTNKAIDSVTAALPMGTPLSSQTCMTASSETVASVDVQASKVEFSQSNLAAPALTREERKLQLELNLFQKMEMEVIVKGLQQPSKVSAVEGLPTTRPIAVASSASADAGKRSRVSQEPDPNPTGAKRSRAVSAMPATDEHGDCGTCKNCLDKRRYGGPGTLRQICVLKVAAKAAAKKAAKAAANPSITLALLHAETPAVQSGPKLVPLITAPSLAAAGKDGATTNDGPNVSRRPSINQRLGKAIDKATQQGPNNVAEPVETSPGAGATPATDAFGDCGTCKNCLDKRRYGGPGTLRQICVLKLAAKAAANPSRTLAMLSTKTGAVQTGPEPKLVPLAEAETDGTTLAIRLSSYKPEPSVTEASGAATLFVSNGLEDCGTCKFCLDKRKNGGPNKWRKACENRRS